ncbi:hypothetical protein Q5752_005808 [Cryptotrichosporon argae]
MAGGKRAYVVSDDESDDGVEVLDEEPVHLRRPSNRDNPIVLDDDLPEPEAGPSAGPSVPRPSKRTRLRARHDDVLVIAPFEVPGLDEVGPSTAVVPPERTAANLLPIVLNILPDLDTEWAQAELLGVVATGEVEIAPNIIIERALNMDKYPKATDKAPAAPQLDYKSHNFRTTERAGEAYRTKALDTLTELFPKIPINHIRTTFSDRAFGLLVPTYMTLKQQLTVESLPFKPLKQGRVYKGKAYSSSHGLMAALGGARASGDEAQLERAFLAAMIEQDELTENALEVERRVQANAKAAKDAEREEAVAAGNALQCGCCFDDFLIDEMGQCLDGHLFCSVCLVKHTETKLGSQQVDITCMDGSGCRADFAQRELRRILPTKLLGLYERLKQARDIELAGLAGLKNCPYCPYAMVIDNPDEKLFQCRNEECRKVTCLQCGKPDHIPKSCQEMEADVKLDHRHAVEEAMSAALMRRCPQCSKPYFKEDGCNKMTCTACGTLSCYSCQKPIKSYDHFSQLPGRADISKPGACPLWDAQGHENDAQRILHARDVAEAAAKEAAQAQGIDLGTGNLVEAPAARAAPAFPLRPQPNPLPDWAQLNGAMRYHLQRLAPHVAALRAQDAVNNLPPRRPPNFLPPNLFDIIAQAPQQPAAHAPVEPPPPPEPEPVDARALAQRIAEANRPSRRVGGPGARRGPS